MTQFYVISTFDRRTSTRDMLYIFRRNSVAGIWELVADGFSLGETVTEIERCLMDKTGNHVGQMRSLEVGTLVAIVGRACCEGRNADDYK